LNSTVSSTSFAIFGAVEEMLDWLWNARQVKLLWTCRSNLVYPMTILKNLLGRSMWPLPAFVVVHVEHRPVLKQQQMLFIKLQLLKMQLRSKTMPKLHLPQL
jgi:hypothetical protein